METFSLSMETFSLYGDFTGTLLYGDFFSLSMETFPLYWDFTGTSRGLFSMETFSLSMDTVPLYGDFTGTLRGLFSMETFPLYGGFTGTLLYGDLSSLLLFTATLLYGDFSSLRGLYGDFTGTLLYGDFSSKVGTSRGLFSMETVPLYSSLRGLFSIPKSPKAVLFESLGKVLQKGIIAEKP